MYQCFRPFCGWTVSHCMDISYFIYAITRWWTLGLLLPLAVVNSAATDTCVQRFIWVPMFDYFGYISATWNGLYRNGLYDSSMFIFLRNLTFSSGVFMPQLDPARVARTPWLARWFPGWSSGNWLSGWMVMLSLWGAHIGAGRGVPQGPVGFEVTVAWPHGHY